MKTWLSRLFGAVRTPPSPAVPAPARRTAAPTRIEPPRAADPLDALRRLAASADGDCAFVAWLTGVPARPQAELGDAEHRALQRLDQRIASARDGFGASLLPRSAAVVPRLLAQLRGESVSLPELAAQVARDLTLVAEVVRMANSARYRRAEAAVTLEQALRVLGVEGLRQAIARAVLKPLIDPPSGTGALGAQRLWDHTDKKAQLCAALARSLGLDAFDGYLRGLVHNAAWSVVLRATDGGPDARVAHIGSAYAAALALRRDPLFGLIAHQWQLPDGDAGRAASPARPQAGGTASPEWLLLDAGHELASRLCGVAPLGDPPPPPEALLDDIGPAASACFRALALPTAAPAENALAAPQVPAPGTRRTAIPLSRP